MVSSCRVVSCRVVCWGDAGKKDFSTDNDDVVFTAAREFHEETGGVLEAVLHALTTVQYSIMPDPVRTAATPGAAAGAAAGNAVLWLGEGQYVLYVINVDTVHGMRAATETVTQAHAAFLRTAGGVGATACMACCRCVTCDDLL